MKFLKVMLQLYLTFCLKESYWQVFNGETLKNKEGVCSGREVNSVASFKCFIFLYIVQWMTRFSGWVGSFGASRFSL